MIRKSVLSILLLALACAMWASPSFVDLAAGVALFMFGMLCLEEGFKRFTGGPLENLLRRSTDRLWKSVAFGTVSTTLMQSSSLVSLITVSFVSAEMIGLAAGIGIIMGANIGTTSGAWLIAGLGLKVNIAAYAMPMLIFGVVFRMQQQRRMHAWGNVMLGFAFLFLGIHYMKGGFESLQGSFDLTAYTMTGVTGVLVYTLVGVLITVIMQSSHATLLVIIAALAAGQISYENSLALAIGANLGSTVTIVLGSVSSNLGGKRLAAFHVLFNLATATAAIALLGPLSDLVDWLARGFGIGNDDYLLKLALFHTLFNVLGVIGWSPFVSSLSGFLQTRMVGKPKGAEQPRFLSASALETPATAVTAVRREVEHLMENASALLVHGINLRRSTVDGDSPLLPAIRQSVRIVEIDVDDAYSEKIKALQNEIIVFIATALSHETTREAADRLYELRRASRDVVEAVKGMKHLHKNLRRHGLSSNPWIREVYDRIRLQLAELLRASRRILREEPGAITMLSLDEIRLEQRRSSREINDRVDELIRERRIPAAIATSIMNDEDYAQGIGYRLLDALKTLRNPDDGDAALAMALDPEDIHGMAGGTSTPAGMTRNRPGEQ
ncbi:MAG: Na/Pi symporter [Halieaceae bacterium]|jgi:phosphate:Na+ symporter|nr:Na/Pi symporter [Halieaceae bacterium]